MAKNTCNMNEWLVVETFTRVVESCPREFRVSRREETLKISRRYTKMDLLRTNQPGNASSVARSHFSLKINPQYLSYRICQKKSVSSHAFKIGSYGREDGNFDTPSHVTSVRRFSSNRLHTTHKHTHTHKTGWWAAVSRVSMRSFCL